MSVSENEVHVEIQEAPNHMMASLRECDLSRMPPVPPSSWKHLPCITRCHLEGTLLSQRAGRHPRCRSFTVSGRLPRSRGSK